MSGPVIRLLGFIGEQPRISPRMMANTAAQSAINSRLDDGTLAPIRESTLIHEIEEEIEQPVTIFRDGDTWLAWDSLVHVTRGPVATDRLYYTGDGAPKMRVGDDVFALAVPRPSAALTASSSNDGDGDTETRVYVYTYVTAYGEESEPSSPSAEIDWKPGETVTLSGFGTVPTGRAIEKQRIYRSQTGAVGQGFYLIAEREASSADFDDDIAADAFQEPLPSADWHAPPSALQGLTVMPNGMMAGFVGKDIYFCEPYRPHAWPEKYVQTVAGTIVAIEALGSSLIVMTDAEPWILQGTMPDTMVMDRIERPFPCINARGVVDLGPVVIYPTQDGLVAVGPDGSVRLLTEGIFSRDSWMALDPRTMVASQVHNRYCAFYSTLGENAERIEGMIHVAVGDDFLIRSDTRGSAAFYDVAERSLFYVETDTMEIRRFDAPYAARRPQYWKSKEFVLPYPESFGAIRIDSKDALSPEEIDDIETRNAAILAANETMIEEGTAAGEVGASMVAGFPVAGDARKPFINIPLNVAVTIFADHEPIWTVTTPNRALRLPGGFKARVWEIAVSGTRIVEQVSMAKSMDALKQAG